MYVYILCRHTLIPYYGFLAPRLFHPGQRVSLTSAVCGVEDETSAFWKALTRFSAELTTCGLPGVEPQIVAVL